MSKIWKILSIDGGGIRGLIPATVLVHLEEQTGCSVSELFDFVAGTSTGAIIALGLTCPAMNGAPTASATNVSAKFSASDMVHFYLTEGPKIFNESLLQTGSEWAFGGAKYDANTLTSILVSYLGQTKFADAVLNVLIPSYCLESRMRRALGISVFCAAGDDGANDNVYDGKAHVDFPASSPYVTACGGTNLTIAGGIRSESVWNDGDGSATGGGISGFFARPEYQQNVAMPANLVSSFAGRGVPDVAAVADPQTGYATLVHGRWGIVGGTSAVAPLYAGLVARLNARLNKSLGFLNDILYSLPKQSNIFNDITSGNNTLDNVQGYVASAGWDPVTGWGTPNGINLLTYLANRFSQSA